MQDPIGVFTEIKEDEHGLFLRGKMRKGFEKTKWIASLIEDGAIDSMSIGFGLGRDGYEYDQAKDVRYLTSVKLYEISLVTIPMNAEARLTSFKSENIEEIKSVRDAEMVLKARGFSVKEAKTIISKIKEFNPCDEDEAQEEKEEKAAEERDVASEILSLFHQELMESILSQVKTFNNHQN
jgi:hypothetical protein